ncbi:PAS domain-containing protein [Brevibacillus reuszeri]|uniref:PAS domain-containing protein n=1 Tax=Brevibacillus reuszeri TaxID=54915 RepID=A0A0K9YKG3_9BACL|nr:sigma 54-interacting transcriptional regulator [Brevibacillus reuszeri]KNB69171.1 sigma-54 specific transcriptional regulator [Brevibacillus reuszeri]MED1860102.1 sigma 54-interacting transcriptional regulator [Brevibacillus reuszeri]GED71706.1 PAS domain-containing protein [Brevibacillus reuszeri]
MTSVDFLDDSFAFCFQSDWQDMARQMNTDALFIMDKGQTITGVVLRECPEELQTIGICTTEEIETRDAEWDQYEQWAMVNQQGVVLGWVKTSELYRHFFRVYKERQANYSLELEAVFNTSYDMFYISDGKGMTQRVSRSSERLYGYSPEDLVGKSIYDLEQSGVFQPSITRLVLERNEKVQVIQSTRMGGRLMVIGTPVKDEHGNIVRVINFSRDITEEKRLQEELENARGLLEGYRQELRKWSELTEQDGEFITKSEQIRQVVILAGKLAEVDSTVLILGESGVGKEVVASYIHNNSQRKEKPFIKINCSAIPEHLLESELFGYEKGAFTGATKEGKPGLFELANEGTLVLDEIGELPLSLQAKLLRVLQEHELVRIGGTKPIKIDVRIIAATNRNLQEETRLGRFREDLYYRLNVVPVNIPPLRERKDDILPLLLFFKDKFNSKYKKTKTFSQEALECLQAYKWPGNVRELQNIVERLIVITDQEVIEVAHLPEMVHPIPHAHARLSVNEILPLKEAIAILEKQLLKMARDKYKTTTRIAEALQVDQSTISRKLSRIK